MSKDRFTLAYPKPEQCNREGVIRISPRCYSRILGVRARTGLPIGNIAEQCVNFALDRMVLMEEEEQDAT